MERRRTDRGAIVLGLILLAVGGWFLLENTFGIALPELDWDKIWPLAIIAVGVAVLIGAWGRMSHGGEQGT